MRAIIEWAAPAAIVVVLVAVAGVPMLVVRARQADLSRAAVATAVDVALLMSLAIVFALTIVFEDGGPSDVRLVPFEKLAIALASGDREGVREVVRDIVLNVALFAPLGVSIALRSRRPSWSQLFVGVTLLSVGIELVQGLVLTGRTADTTDVLTNVTGALLAYAIGRRAVDWLGRGVSLHPRRAA